MGARDTAKGRVLVVLKTSGSLTTARIARRLGITTTGARQHLDVLEEQGLVDFTDVRSKVGRPARLWHLTAKASQRFSDSHAELALTMLRAIKRTFGDQGLARLVSEQTRQQAEAYRARMPDPNASLGERVARLARLRREEGYMAESRRTRHGTFELIENHCSIAKAARAYPNLCNGELALFRAVLGKGVVVHCSEHLLAGDRRCVYRLADRSAPPPQQSARGRFDAAPLLAP